MGSCVEMPVYGPLNTTSRFPTAAVGVVAHCCLLLLGCTPSQPAASKPNIILITVDTLRVDALGAYGGPATPHLDAWAARSVLFEHAFAPMPRTTPSLGSLVTGLWPHHHGSREVGEPMRASSTLASRLPSYSRGAVVGASVVGRATGVTAGYETLAEPEAIEARVLRDGVGRAEATTALAIEAVDGMPADKPKHLWVHYFSPHFRYTPPSRWSAGHDATQCWELYAHLRHNPEKRGRVYANRDGMAEQARAHCRMLYDDEVRYTDWAIGRLLAALERRGVLQSACLVFTADHGENLGEGALWYEHGDNVHDVATHVPLWMSGCGIRGGRRESAAVSLVDVLPTLRTWLGLPDGPKVDGDDLAPALRGKALPPREVFGESASALMNDGTARLVSGRADGRHCIHDGGLSLCRDAGGDGTTLHDRNADTHERRDLVTERPASVARLQEGFQRWTPEGARRLFVHDGRFKLEWRPRLEGGYRELLFDVTNDPAESTNLGANHPRYGALAARLRRWLKDYPRDAPVVRDAKTEAQLRALGYVK